MSHFCFVTLLCSNEGISFPLCFRGWSMKVLEKYFFSVLGLETCNTEGSLTLNYLIHVYNNSLCLFMFVLRI